MGGHLGRLECGLGAGTGGELFQLCGQGREQFLFDLVHELILRCPPCGVAAHAPKEKMDPRLREDDVNKAVIPAQSLPST